MPSTRETTDSRRLPGEGIECDHVAGHWLLARMGKRVLRPGGVALTHRLLEAIDIGPNDDVVEIAPGLGATTRLILQARPASYRAVDRDPVAAERVARIASAENCAVIQGSAAETGLEPESVDVAFGEAYLTMQPAAQKDRILTELHRILRDRGRTAIHEVAFREGVTEEERRNVTEQLRSSIRVHVSPLSEAEWGQLLEEHGFSVAQVVRAPLHLLEPRRLINDEGYLGSLRFALRMLRDSDARRRVMAMRRSMSGNSDVLGAVMITAVKSGS